MINVTQSQVLYEAFNMSLDMTGGPGKNEAVVQLLGGTPEGLAAAILSGFHKATRSQPFSFRRPLRPHPLFIAFAPLE